MMNYSKLIISVQTLIEFLKPTGSEFWVEKLSDIASGLRTEDRAEISANNLENLYGGMGSLNDLYFCETNENLPTGENEKEFNEKFSLLMDRVFKELRLRNANFMTRLHWSYLAWKHRKELAPRIKKTFKHRSVK
jgi:hypothetical protein